MNMKVYEGLIFHKPLKYILLYQNMKDEGIN